MKGDEKMKKYFGGAFLSIALLVVGIGIASAYTIGPNKLFIIDAKVGKSLKGNWTEATMKNNYEAPWKYEKRVYAQAGGSGSWSKWVDKTVFSVTHRDYGSLFDDTATTSGEWR